MRPSFHIFILAMALLTPVAGPWAHAESLADAVADAYRHNPQLQAQRAELRALDESVIEASAPYQLRADLGGTFTYSDRRQRGLSQEGFVRFEQRAIDARLTVSQLISSGGRVASQVSAAEADVFSGPERLREVENLILRDLIDASAAVRRDEQLVAIQGRSAESYQRQVNQNRSRESEGDLSRTDVAQAEAQLLIIRAALAQAMASVQQSRSRFAVTVGRNPGTLNNVSTLPNLPNSIEAAFDAAGSSPAVTQALFNKRAGRHRIAAARAERAPLLSLQGDYGYTNPTDYQIRDLGRNVGAGFTVTMPILAQGVIGSRVRSAIATQQAAAFRVDDVRRAIDAALLNGWNQILTAQEQLRAGTAAVAAAEVALGGVRRGFAEGFRSNFEVIDSEQRLLNAQILVTNARYAMISGQAALLSFLGRLTAPALLPGLTAYSASTNLARERRRQVGPFEPLIAVFDRVGMPSDRSRPPLPIVAVAPAAIAPATVPLPAGPLATTIPLDTDPSRSTPVSTRSRRHED